MREEEWRTLVATVFSEPQLEGAAYLLCGVSRSDSELRFLARKVVPVVDAEYALRERAALSISSPSYVRAAKQAVAGREAILFGPSHPNGYPDFSPQDDREEPRLHRFLSDYATHALHGSLVISTAPKDDLEAHSTLNVRARVWTPAGWSAMDRIRIIGDRFVFLDRVSGAAAIPTFFDRQVRAFGTDIQRLLGRLHVGVVGAGGTGSSVLEQLTRLGVGHVSVFDGDRFDETNVNRVYGSTVNDGGRPKSAIARDSIARIGVRTVRREYSEFIEDESTAKSLRDCDIIFSCTDDHTSRAILVRLALWYLIPIFDLGVKVDSQDQVIKDVVGRVTTLLAGEACLFCRGRISADTIRQEGLPPDAREREVRDGYIPPLATAAPAVITFTTAVAAQAVTELLDRLTGFMGTGNHPSELFLRFDQRDISTNQVCADPACQCMDRDRWGRGDEGQFLRRGWLPGVRDRNR
jgi:hypothetical protein